MEQTGSFEQLLMLAGVDESMVNKKLEEFQKLDALKLTLSKNEGLLSLVLRAEAENEKEAKKIVKPVVRQLKADLGKYIFSTSSQVSLEEAVVDLLHSEHLTVTFAESCTGGALSAKIVNVSGASNVFGCSYITYSDKAKRKCLMVKKGTLRKDGAVSAKCAREMAKGACYASGADVGVSVTGFAGPEGGTKENPVGTVYLGCCYHGNIQVRELHLKGNRSDVRTQAVVYALAFLRECILEGVPKK